MIFNSIDFIIFLPIVFLLYWFVTQKNLWGQNVLILVASYLFYGWWDWKFLFLIAFSTLLDFSIGIALGKEQKIRMRKILLATSVIVNLGLLGFFKYYNFFIENFIEAFTFFGYKLEASSLNIILPVGISFYTFQTLSYTIDVYRKKIQPSKDLVSFASFVSFFPQLVAGPIERASNLLPQFDEKRTFIYAKAVDGLRQILWGLFKKIVIADSCAEYANILFNNSSDYSGSSLLMGAFFFAFQIYGDFSGYSDIAIGTSRLFGFELKQNFNFPYFSRDIAEFWRKWHISLTTWFRDYVYIPLGGSKGNMRKTIRNTFIIFLISGFWHGANWTFIFWGLINALYFLPILLTHKNRKNQDVVAEGRFFPTLKEFISILFTFILTMLAWIFFRANSVQHAFGILTEIFSKSLFSKPVIYEAATDLPILPKTLFLILFIFILIEWIGRGSQFAIEKIGLNWTRPLRLLFYFILIITLFIFSGKDQQFIYFQF